MNSTIAKQKRQAANKRNHTHAHKKSNSQFLNLQVRAAIFLTDILLHFLALNYYLYHQSYWFKVLIKAQVTDVIYLKIN